MATLVHDERLKDGDEAYLQFALLYTTTDGHRRIRCAAAASIWALHAVFDMKS